MLLMLAAALQLEGRHQAVPCRPLDITSCAQTSEPTGRGLRTEPPRGCVLSTDGLWLTGGFHGALAVSLGPEAPGCTVGPPASGMVLGPH